MEKKKSSNYWKYYLLLLLLLVITFNVDIFSNSLKYTSNTEESLDKKTELFDLKNSGSQINITTPENKTYTKPMTGFYPATYGFENDKTGNFPYGWILENSGGTASIIDSIGDHKKVLQLYDNNGSNGVDLTNLFDSSQSSGTIEWWWRISDVTKISTFEIRDGSSLTITLNVRNSEFQYYRGGYLSVQSVSNDIWYHHRIDFNCGTDKFDWYIDDAKKVDQGNFRTVATSVDRVFLHTQEVDSNFYNYFDAISYFWDTDYTIGDNLDEGLLVSFDLGFSPDWLGYSLEGQANSTVLGNTTIPLPTVDGVHTIQVFGNDSSNNKYESDIRYFSIQHINIITPENITYTEPMSGYYPATYGFENDEDGSNPNDWTIDETGGTVNVIAQLGGHNKILELHDTSGASNVDADNSFTAQTYGTVEFWIRTNDATDGSFFRIYNDAILGVNFWIQADKFSTGESGGNTDIVAASDNVWYHIKIEFECGAGGYQGLAPDTLYIWIDNVRYGSYNFDNAVTSLNKINLLTSTANSGYYAYFDAVSYSWAPSYTIGNNLDEGLLVSFDLGFSPDWLGYSLDSQSNKTILGNTTISFPSEGFHTIQIFGNHSSSTLYESEIRCFSIDFPPRIIINKPSQYDIFGLIAPSFNITIDDLSLNTTWYTLDNGIRNITFTGLTGIINQTEWDKQISSSVTIQFYANDTIGREDFEEVIVLKDTIAPILTINTPDQDEFYADTPPSFDITIDDLSLNTTWYTLDNGNNNFTFTGLIGTVEHTVWDNMAEGPVTIRFYANDTFDYRNYAEITIYKDTTDPILTINNPSSGLSFTILPPAYNIEVEEINLESIWYTIDGGLNNFEITELTGYIDSNAWNAAPNGAITIRFYAEDKAGNLVYNDIIVQKSTPLPPLDINLVIIIVAIVSIIGVAVLGGLVYRKKHVRIKKLRLEVGEVEKSARPKRTKRAKTKKEPSLVEQPIFSCPFCQAELPGDQKYCFYCGAKLKE